MAAVSGPLSAGGSEQLQCSRLLLEIVVVATKYFGNKCIIYWLDIKPVTQVNASTKPSVYRAVSLFKAKGMLSNFLNLFSAEVRRKISSDTASKECRELRNTVQ